MLQAWHNFVHVANTVILYCCCATWSEQNLFLQQLDKGIRNLLWNGSLSGVQDFFDRNKILSGGDLSHYQVPHCIRVFFYFVWFVFTHHSFQFYFELCTYCNILDIYLS